MARRRRLLGVARLLFASSRRGSSQSHCRWSLSSPPRTEARTTTGTVTVTIASAPGCSASTKSGRCRPARRAASRPRSPKTSSRSNSGCGVRERSHLAVAWRRDPWAAQGRRRRRPRRPRSLDDSSRALYSCDKIGEHEGARLQLARGGILVDARRGHFERTVLSARWKLPALRQFGSRQHQGAADQSVSHRACTIAADAADSVHLTFLASSRRSASRLNSSTYCSARSGRSVTPTR